MVLEVVRMLAVMLCVRAPMSTPSRGGVVSPGNDAVGMGEGEDVRGHLFTHPQVESPPPPPSVYVNQRATKRVRERDETKRKKRN